MQVKIEEKTEIKFFKWVIISKTLIHNSRTIENEPIWVNNKEYFDREFFRN